MYSKSFRFASLSVLIMLSALMLSSCAIVRPPAGYEKIVLGENSEKLPVYLMTLRNGGAEVAVSNLGGRIRSIRVPDRRGKLREVLHARPEESPLAVGDESLIGALIPYPPASERSQAFAGYIWRMEPFKKGSKVGVRLSRRPRRYGSDILGDGFIEVIYSLSKDRALKLEYITRGGAKDIGKLCNPLSLNFSGTGSRTIGDHQMAVVSDSYCPDDSSPVSVDDTAYDLRQPELIGKLIDRVGTSAGLNGRWAIQKPATDIDLAASLYNPENGIYLELFINSERIEVDTVHTPRLAGEAPNSSITFLPLSSGEQDKPSRDGLQRSVTVFRFSTI